MRHLLCLFGFHKRSRGRAHDDGATMVSVCRHCGKPMTRQRDGKWVLSRQAIHAGGAES